MITLSILAATAVRVEHPLFYEKLGWGAGKPVAAGSSISFTISLHQRNIVELKRLALAVSTPGTASYGVYLTTREVDELTAPAPEARIAVASWLNMHDVNMTL